MQAPRHRYRGNPDAVRALVRPREVHRDVYIDEEVFQLEMEHLFANSWVYAGHAIQASESGDFVTSEIALRRARRFPGHHRSPAITTAHCRVVEEIGAKQGLSKDCPSDTNRPAGTENVSTTAKASIRQPRGTTSFDRGQTKCESATNSVGFRRHLGQKRRFKPSRPRDSPYKVGACRSRLTGLPSPPMENPRNIISISRRL